MHLNFFVEDGTDGVISDASFLHIYKLPSFDSGNSLCGVIEADCPFSLTVSEPDIGQILLRITLP